MKLSNFDGDDDDDKNDDDDDDDDDDEEANTETAADDREMMIRLTTCMSHTLRVQRILLELKIERTLPLRRCATQVFG